MSLDNAKISFIASQLGLRPDQRRGLHEHLRPFTKEAAPDAIQAASARRLARLEAATAANSPELKNLLAECKRLGVPISSAGIDVASLRRHPRLSPEKRMQLLSAANAVGLLED